ncbi:metalloprotease [Ephemerocybe angulata]|uniref:Extracellular metalloproteinase n=1 Tax=Ephemerocybe angulata TaxID=980116 RepID=A0A8H6HIA2_9AGAR|nr:metalloprotease [Tulosesus angulatus]
MSPIRGLLSYVLAALALTAQAQATSLAPFSHSTHHRTTIGRRGLQLETYNPPSSFETFGEGLVQEASFAPSGLDGEARAYVANKLKVDGSTVEFRAGFSSPNARHAYVRQRYNGIPFVNAVANVAFKDNKVVSFSSSFVKPKSIAPSEPTVDVQTVIPKLEEQLEGKYNNHPTKIEYLARPDGSAALVHVVQIQNEEANSWYEAFVDAHNGELLSITDFTADASYRVLPIHKQELPQGTELLVDPYDPLSSPAGWQLYGGVNTTTTSGNNVIAYKGTQTNVTSQSAPGPVFDYTYDTALAPGVGTNVDAARTNAFYVINRVHDFAYRYGFTEAAFNFQTENFGKGGAAGDRVLISVQDSSGTNNANFATPPDGQSGTARMYIWTRSTPNRDGVFQNDIIVHEMTHGITNRLTGGGTARCLQSTESRGMGEGWSDAMANWTEQNETVSDWVHDAYVANNPAGTRTHPYSTDKSVNPYTYGSLKTQDEVHLIGETWANMLHNVYAPLVAKYGWSPESLTNPDGAEGNIVYMHLFIDALSIQPCNPTLVQARDAWIQADANRYNGVNKCLLWQAFASRGLGLTAANYTDNFDVPADCF